MKRRIDIEAISQNIFDIAIIGGGITGAGILREATKRGYRCILIEKNDFASGTSSKSAKLVHGGLRYLQYGKFALVNEGLRERHYLLKNFPHLVKPLQFLFPVYKSKFKIHLGMWLYKIMSFDKDLAHFEFLNKEKTQEKFPAINPQNLKGSFLFYDAVTNDALLCNEIILNAQKSGAIALNYCEFINERFVNKNYFEIFCSDKIENSNHIIKTKYIVNATGHWTDETLQKMNFQRSNFVAPSKGVHLVFSRKTFPTETAILFPSNNNDGRTMYAVPWENDTVVIGTTDTEHFNNFDNVKADDGDVRYILNSIQKFAPMLKISEKDIIGKFAGLRPLLNNNSPSKDRSRDYKCLWTSENILTIAGGKFTSFHAMAKSVLRKIEEKISPFPHYNLENIQNSFRTEYDTENYNKQSWHSKIIFFIREMNCFYLDDILTRRLSLTYAMQHHPAKNEIIKSTAEIIKKEFNLSEKEMNEEIKKYCQIHNINLN